MYTYHLYNIIDQENIVYVFQIKKCCERKKLCSSKYRNSVIWHIYCNIKILGEQFFEKMSMRSFLANISKQHYVLFRYIKATIV